MSFVSLSEAIRERFRTLVAEPMGMQVVSSNDPTTKTAKRFCQLTIDIQTAAQAGTGAEGVRRFRATGRVALNLFDGANVGDAWLLEVMDAITTAFRGVSLSDPFITFGTPSPIGQSSRDEAGGHWRLPAQIPFRVDFFGDG